MDDLVYGNTNNLCVGCPVLTEDKAFHCFADYEELEQHDILFVSDSFKYKYGEIAAFTDQDLELIESVLPEGTKYGVTASIKCPGVTDKKLSVKTKKACRAHLEATLVAAKPKLVFACGNLALKMLTNKSGIASKRGQSYIVEAGDHKCTVVPIFHPHVVTLEPKNKYLFDIDISNAINKVIVGQEVMKLDYEFVGDEFDVHKITWLYDTSSPLACDVETEGLDFRNHKIHTVSVSCEDKTYVFPLYHKESPFDIFGRAQILIIIQKILENPNNVKIFHNATFDVKFFMVEGINVVNPTCTKLMQHLVDENVPKGLIDLVRLYMPEMLETL